MDCGIGYRYGQRRGCKIWQRDVNNYLLVKTSGKIKRKGAWLMDDFHRPGTVKYGPLDAFICSKAATKYLVEGIDPAVTLVQCKNLNDFAITCKKVRHISRLYKGLLTVTKKSFSNVIVLLQQKMSLSENCTKLNAIKILYLMAQCPILQIIV